MADYLTTIVTQFGISVWVFILVFVWSMVWKLLALWKSARKGSIVWFIVLAITNTLGILPILYFFLFSKMKTGKRAKRKK